MTNIGRNELNKKPANCHITHMNVIIIIIIIQVHRSDQNAKCLSKYLNLLAKRFVKNALNSFFSFIRTRDRMNGK